MYNNISDWDRMVEGKLYNSSSCDINLKHIKGMSRCHRFNRIAPWRFFTKKRALERLIPSAKGKNLTIFAPVYCEYGVNIKVGKGCFMNYNCVLLDISPITLGNQVWLGANVTIATPNHPIIASERIVQKYPDGEHDLEYSNPVVIKDNVWVCSGAIICGGVTIGENSVIAAGAVVTKDVPANSVVMGVPAKVVRQIDETDRLNVWETYVKNEIPKKQGKI